MRRLESYQQYHQHWPFDAKKKVLSTEALEEEQEANDSAKRYQGGITPDFVEDILDAAAVDEMLEGLTDRQAEVVRMTAENFRPRDIAATWGEDNSNRVRQDKYAALRTLGAPVNVRMRRVSS